MNLINDFKRGVIIGTGIILSIGIISISYSAFQDIIQVNPTEKLTAETFNKLITNQEDLKSRLDGINPKSIATAWVQFDGTTTPPTIKDSFNVDDVIRTADGRFQIHFAEDMDNTDYVFSYQGDWQVYIDTFSLSNIAVRSMSEANVERNRDNMSLIVFGGKD